MLWLKLVHGVIDISLNPCYLSCKSVASSIFGLHSPTERLPVECGSNRILTYSLILVDSAYKSCSVYFEEWSQKDGDLRTAKVHCIHLQDLFVSREYLTELRIIAEEESG